MAEKEYRFEVFVSNSTRNTLQNITGKYGSISGGVFTAKDCYAGHLCKKNARMPLEGYDKADIKNGNSWYMETATTGVIAGATGDHTGIYVCNNYDVAKANVNGMTINFGGAVLGNGLLADERGDFTELMVDEQYNFGKDNFSTLPTNLTTTPYATIDKGQWKAAAAAPTDGGVYAEILSIGERYTEGAYDAGQKITLCIKRSVKA